MDREAFETEDGRPVPAVTASEMREVDRVAVEEFGIEVLQMMEHAGRALAGVVTLALPKTGLAEFDGDLHLADIGLPADVYDRLDIPSFNFDGYVVALSPP